MAIVCPACGKAAQAEAVCQRCGCDLSPLHAVCEAAVSCLGAAHAALSVGNWRGALGLAERSWSLRHAPSSARTAFLAAAAAGDTREALLWRARAGKNES